MKLVRKKTIEKLYDTKYILEGLHALHVNHLESADRLHNIYGDEFEKHFSEFEERIAKLVKRYEKRFLKLSRKVYGKFGHGHD